MELKTLLPTQAVLCKLTYVVEDKNDVLKGFLSGHLACCELGMCAVVDVACAYTAVYQEG